jgi:hypothetical protein
MKAVASRRVASSCGFDAPEGAFHYSALLLSFGFQSSSLVLLARITDTSVFDELQHHKCMLLRTGAFRR